MQEWTVAQTGILGVIVLIAALQNAALVFDSRRECRIMVTCAALIGFAVSARRCLPQLRAGALDITLVYAALVAGYAAIAVHVGSQLLR